MYWSLGETLPHEPLVHVLWKPPLMYFASFPPITITCIPSKVENSWPWKAIGNWTRKGTTSSIASRLGVGKWLVKISVEPGAWSAHPPVPSSWHLFWFVPPLRQLSIFKEPESVFSINILPGVGIKWMEKGSQVPECQSAHRLHHMPALKGQAEACQRCVRACPRSRQIDETSHWTVHGQINVLVLQDKGKTRYGHLILTVITDSMDRGKFVVPRYLDSRTPKDVANLNRPSCEVTASIIHGRMIYVAVADEGEATGSSWVLEVLSRSLDSAYCQAQRKGWCWPTILKIFADNTPKDIKSCWYHPYFICCILRVIVQAHSTLFTCTIL